MDKIQAIVKIDGIHTMYFYDEFIKKLIAAHVKLNLKLNNKKFDTIQIDLNIPPLKHKEHEKL